LRTEKRKLGHVQRLATGALLLGALFGARPVLAAPAGTECADKSAVNCFQDEVYFLDGNLMVMRAADATAAPAAVPLVACKATMDGMPDATDCYLGGPADAFKADALGLTVQAALEQMKTAAPTLPAWDEVVVFYTDFGPKTQPGPLFFRMKNTAGAFVNRVTNIGLGEAAEPDADKPYVGIIDGGNLKTIGATPGAGSYSPCGKLPRPLAAPPAASDQAAGALCAPGVYNYFDALAQATAAIYGPHLPDVMVGGKSVALVTPPLIKGALVQEKDVDDGTGVITKKILSKFPDGGLSVDGWNALLDTGGSLLGGNTWRQTSTGIFEAAAPPPFFGAAAPDSARRALRFQPLDLYLLGFAPEAEVGPLRAFTGATAADFYLPASSSKLSSIAGPGMGVRTGGVQLRGRNGLSTSVSLADIQTAAGGARTPDAASAPQVVRQLWIVVTKPTAVRDAAWQAALAKDPAASKEEFDKAQTKEAETERANAQKMRRAYNQYFYLATGYRGRVLTTSEGNVSDLAYWEFADAVDDTAAFTATGLQVELRGPEVVPGGAGALQSVLRVTSTPGATGTLTFNAASLPLRIQSAQSLPLPNNVFTVRMRLPKDPALARRVKARLVLTREGGEFATDVPSNPEAFLVPDGRFHNYTVLLSKLPGVGPNSDPMSKEPLVSNPDDNAAYVGQTYTGLTFTPSNVPLNSIEIESLRVGNYADVAEKDKDCGGVLRPDGLVGDGDNCPGAYNADQSDSDNDGVGDACEDFDGDGVPNACDNCGTLANRRQQDADRDGKGDACDSNYEAPSNLATCALGSTAVPSSSAGAALSLWLGALALVALPWRRRTRR